MAPQLDVSIPSTSTSQTSKPYTIYTLSIRQPLRNYTVEKRYSDFTTLHSVLQTQCPDATTPAPLPAKTWFKSTVSNPAVAEERRRGLEQYISAILNSTDARWRNALAWREFLQLPARDSAPSSVKNAARGHDAPDDSMDPGVWLDTHRDLKAEQRDARTHLARRDQASTAHEQHEASADAKRCLVKAGAHMTALEQGLSSLGRTRAVGEGEMRRRKDLLSAARKEGERLEALLSAYATKKGASGTDSAAATATQRDNLLSDGASSRGGAGGGRRVLGGHVKETERTRELDNAGVLQLQKQIIDEQDSDVVDLTKVVRRMKEMGVQINDELQMQNQMLDMLDNDVDRVGGKINVAKKRIGRIS